MEDAPLIRSGSQDDRVLDWAFDRDLYLGLAEVDRYGGTSGQGKVQLTGFVKHPLGVVPIIGEVLVVKHRRRALALLENPDNLLIDPPARQEPVTLEIGWIVPVFPDDDHTIHRQFLPAECDSLANCLIDGNILRLADFLTQSARVQLMNVH